MMGSAIIQGTGTPLSVGGESARLPDNRNAAMAAAFSKMAGMRAPPAALFVGESPPWIGDESARRFAFADKTESTVFVPRYQVVVAIEECSREIGLLAEPSEIAEQFDELDEYADETDCPRPTNAARETARRLALSAHRRYSRYYAIYPTSEGGVAVQTTIRKGAVILIDCLPEGGVTIFFRIDDEHHRAHYSPQSAGSLPDAFFHEAIDKLRREAESRA